MLFRLLLSAIRTPFRANWMPQIPGSPGTFGTNQDAISLDFDLELRCGDRALSCLRLSVTNSRRRSKIVNDEATRSVSLSGHEIGGQNGLSDTFAVDSSRLSEQSNFKSSWTCTGICRICTCFQHQFVPLNVHVPNVESRSFKSFSNIGTDV